MKSTSGSWESTIVLTVGRRPLPDIPPEMLTFGALIGWPSITPLRPTPGVQTPN